MQKCHYKRIVKILYKFKSLKSSILVTEFIYIYKIRLKTFSGLFFFIFMNVINDDCAQQ